VEFILVKLSYENKEGTHMPHFIQENDGLLFQGNSIMDTERNLENVDDLIKGDDTHKQGDVLR
jgi:hypothetical protein